MLDVAMVLDMMPKTQGTKDKTDNVDFIKMKTCVFQNIIHTKGQILYDSTYMGDLA